VRPEVDIERPHVAVLFDRLEEFLGDRIEVDPLGRRHHFRDEVVVDPGVDERVHDVDAPGSGLLGRLACDSLDEVAGVWATVRDMSRPPSRGM